MTSSGLRATAATGLTVMRVIAMLMMMLMMMTTVAAAPKAAGQSQRTAKTHRKSAVETVPLQLDPALLTPPANIRPLENASISPWAYNVSSEDELFPPLSEARCLLRGCLDLDGRELLNLESRPIMRQVLLLRRVRAGPQGAQGVQGAGPHGHAYYFRLESRLVAVGCTCVRPSVRQQL